MALEFTPSAVKNYFTDSSIFYALVETQLPRSIETSRLLKKLELIILFPKKKLDARGRIFLFYFQYSFITNQFLKLLPKSPIHIEFSIQRIFSNKWLNLFVGASHRKSRYLSTFRTKSVKFIRPFVRTYQIEWLFNFACFWTIMSKSLMVVMLTKKVHQHQTRQKKPCILCQTTPSFW